MNLCVYPTMEWQVKVMDRFRPPSIDEYKDLLRETLLSAGILFFKFHKNKTMQGW